MKKICLYLESKLGRMMTVYLIDKYRKYRDEKYRKQRFRLGIDRLLYEQSLIENVYIPASIVHQQVFPKYKNILKGKKVVLIAGGPTVDFFEPSESDKYIYAGINFAFLSSKWKLRFLFAGDRWVSDIEQAERIQSKLDEYEGDGCIKFLAYRSGMHISQIHRDIKNVESYYIAPNDYGQVYKKDLMDIKYAFPVDISVSPVKAYETTAISAMQILLWMHPDEILLVGCDCSIGHSHLTYNDDHCDAGYSEEDFTEARCNWELLKKFTDDFYPDIKITSVNPVGLKGLFNDIYSDAYLQSEK